MKDYSLSVTVVVLWRGQTTQLLLLWWWCHCLTERTVEREIVPVWWIDSRGGGESGWVTEWFSFHLNYIKAGGVEEVKRQMKHQTRTSKLFSHTNPHRVSPAGHIFLISTPGVLKDRSLLRVQHTLKYDKTLWVLFMYFFHDCWCLPVKNTNV